MPILQINFTFDLPLNEYQDMCRPAAPVIANVAGLRWKVWLMNEQEREAGGIYAFETDQAMNDYLGGPIIGKLKTNPAIRDLRIKKFAVLEDVTSVTRGPIAITAAA